MIDYHTREKISHSGKRISPSSRVIFFFQSVIFFSSCGSSRVLLSFQQVIFPLTIIEGVITAEGVITGND
jgi:hypothetical protein